MNRLRVGLASVAALLVTVTAEAATYYVATTGSDANPGTSVAPFRTVQKGVNAAMAGETVIVRPGIYDERIVIPRSGAPGSPITLQGEPGAILDGNQRITGWQPAPEIAPGVYKKPMSEMPFTPGAIAYNGKFALWVWWDGLDSCDDWPMGWERLRTPLGSQRMEMAGAYGYASHGHGLPYAYPNVSCPGTTNTAYVKLRTGGNPDNEDVTFADVNAPTILIDGTHDITIRGLTIRNGFGQIEIRNGATGTMIENNILKGGALSIFVRAATHTTIRNNDSTLNHSYGEELPPAYVKDVGYDLLGDLRHAGRHNKNARVWLEEGGVRDTKIYNNHFHGDLAGIVGGSGGTLEIYQNTIHHLVDYALEYLLGKPVTAFVHDNLIYSPGLEAWREDAIHNQTTAYIYRNRFVRVSRGDTCGPGGYPGCGTNDLEFSASDATLYLYHNSFAGGTAFTLSNYFGHPSQPASGGLPNTWVLNNIVSSEYPFQLFNGETWPGDVRWHFDYNWVGNDPSYNNPGMNWILNWGSHNKPHANELMWDLAKPSWIPTGDTVASGIDLSKPWALDGVSHAALPGMTPGYFSGSAPDLGWYDAGGSGPSAPTLTFTASPTTLPQGQLSTLAWSSTNATSCTASGPSGWSGSKPTSGSEPVSPSTTTTYTLSCTGSGGSVTASAIVTIIPPPSQEPLAHWTFDESSGVVATDASGNGHAGTLIGGPTWTAGRVGGALAFDGVDDYVEVGDKPLLDLTGSLTVALWVKAAAPHVGVLLNKFDNRTPDQGYLLLLDDGAFGPGDRLTWQLKHEDAVDQRRAATSFLDGAWHHVAAIYTANGAARPQLYLDGVEQTAGALSGTPLPAIGTAVGYSFRLGAYSPFPGFYFKGALDDVRLYNRALTAQEIQTLAGRLLVGDLNQDGKRDLADVRLLIYMLIGQQAKTPEADLTGDGAVTLADLQALIKLLVGIP